MKKGKKALHVSESYQRGHIGWGVVLRSQGSHGQAFKYLDDCMTGVL